MNLPKSLYTLGIILGAIVLGISPVVWYKCILPFIIFDLILSLITVLCFNVIIEVHKDENNSI